MKSTMSVCVGITVILSSCDKPTEPGAVFTVSRFPLAAGNVWNYQGEHSLSRFRLIVSGAMFRDTTYRWAAKVEIIGEQVLQDSVHTWRFHLSDNFARAFPPDTFRSTSNEDKFYLLRSDTLFFYAYGGGSSAPTPKTHSRYTDAYQEKVFAPMCDLLNVSEDDLPSISLEHSDSITYLLNPKKSLVFPLRNGSEWTYSERSTTSVRVGKKYIVFNPLRQA